MTTPAQSFWRPLPAGIALGMSLLLAFLLTGHGLEASGFFARLSAWVGGTIAADATRMNAYLGPLLEGSNLPRDWITWQVAGVALGAAMASLGARRFHLQIETIYGTGPVARLALAFAGGALAGLGARIAKGCTASMGMSGAATLAVAGFVFLLAFFLASLCTNWMVRKARS